MNRTHIRSLVALLSVLAFPLAGQDSGSALLDILPTAQEFAGGVSLSGQNATPTTAIVVYEGSGAEVGGMEVRAVTANVEVHGSLGETAAIFSYLQSLDEDGLLELLGATVQGLDEAQPILSIFQVSELGDGGFGVRMTTVENGEELGLTQFFFYRGRVFLALGFITPVTPVTPDVVIAHARAMAERVDNTAALVEDPALATDFERPDADWLPPDINLDPVLLVPTDVAGVASVDADESTSDATSWTRSREFSGAGLGPPGGAPRGWMFLTSDVTIYKDVVLPAVTVRVGLDSAWVSDQFLSEMRSDPDVGAALTNADGYFEEHEPPGDFPPARVVRFGVNSAVLSMDFVFVMIAEGRYTVSLGAGSLQGRVDEQDVYTAARLVVERLRASQPEALLAEPLPADMEPVVDDLALAINLTQRDDYLGALEAYERVCTVDCTLIRPDEWVDVCWYGALEGGGARVLDACDQAVSGAPDDYTYWDSRGLARGLAGDLSGAASDFAEAQALYDFEDEWSARRGGWIKSLENGTNPFNDKELEWLRGTRS